MDGNVNNFCLKKSWSNHRFWGFHVEEAVGDEPYDWRCQEYKYDGPVYVDRPAALNGDETWALELHFNTCED